MVYNKFQNAALKVHSPFKNELDDLYSDKPEV